MKISIDRLKKEHKIYIEYEDNQFEVTELERNFQECTKGPLKVEITIFWINNNNIRISGKTSGNFNFVCDRCLEPFERMLVTTIDDIFELTDEEIINKEINLDEKIREIVINSFPIKILCKENCKGICLGCKVNLNKENCKCK